MDEFEEFEEWEEEPELSVGACEVATEPEPNLIQPAAVIYLPGAPGQGWSLFNIYRPQTPPPPARPPRRIGFLP